MNVWAFFYQIWSSGWVIMLNWSIIWKVAAALFKYVTVFLPGGLPEGVPEVHTPSFQLLRVVGRHVGKLPEDVKVCGVSWWRRKQQRWWKRELIGHGNSQNIFYMKVKNRKQRSSWVRKEPHEWRPRHREASPLSALQILGLYSARGHGNGWIYKSSWTLLCPMRAPRLG